ncbi:MAG: hypothetical protein ATN36_07420 [Epulopiscium sp. Nele67-Bin005]|nr:MAG: hypothetical protein ATN36_07420 [Epulopiscium sp. Nele67-Bin005]
MEKITFIDDEFNEILFEIVDQIEIDGTKYLLVEDEDEVATILKEAEDESSDEISITYQLIEDQNEFQKVMLSFMESDEYDIEI